jgi:predicted alpha/beta superfamily hydrolase
MHLEEVESTDGAPSPPPQPSGQWRWERYPPKPGNGNHTVVGDLRRLEGLYSPRLDNQRDVFAYLPPSYHNGERRYPVIYMHDGQNLFDEVTSFAEEWGVDNNMEALGEIGLEAIVIGISNAGDERLDEYSPFEDNQGRGGKGDRYLDFITETLKPAIDEDFRTLPDRDHTAIVGSSMGGLISLYAFFRRGDVFGRVGALSPALWFADRAIFDFIDRAPRVDGRIYLDVGTLEGARTLGDVRQMRNLLIHKGYELDRDLLYVEDEEGQHSERHWRERSLKTFGFLLAARPA